MVKPECKTDFENRQLILSDEKCDNCEYEYECPYYLAELTDVTYGGWE